MNQNDKLYLDAGEDTEALINFIFKELPDDLVDEVGLYRIFPDNTGPAREPFTTSAIVTSSSMLIVAILKLVRLWMEHKRQDKITKLVFDAAKENFDAARLLKELEKEHSKVVIEFEKVRLPEFKNPRA